MSFKTDLNLNKSQIDLAYQKVSDLLDRVQLQLAACAPETDLPDDWTAACAGLGQAAHDLAHQNDEILLELQNTIQALQNEIDRREQVEKALAASRSKYNTLINSLPIAVTIAGSDGQILETNPEAERVLGLSVEEHLQRSIDGPQWTIIHPDGSPMPASEYASTRALHEKCRVDNVEMGIVKPDGGVTWLNVSATPLEVSDGGLVVCYSDITERKNNEEQLHLALENLRQSEERFRFLFETLPTGVIYMDEQAQVIAANVVAQRITGLSLAQMQGHDSIDPHWRRMRLDGLDYALEDLPYARALRTGQPVIEEIGGFYHPEDDRIYWAEVSAVPMFQPGQSQPHQVYILYVDITSRKQAEQALIESEDRYRQLFDTMAEGLILCEVIKDENGEPVDYRFVNTNPAFEKQSGLKLEQIIGKRAQEVIPEESLFTFEVIKQIDRTGDPVRYQMYSPSVDRFFETTVFCPAPGLVAVTFLDVTERVQTMDALRRSEEKYRHLFETIPLGVVYQDARGRINSANPAAERILGLSLAQMQGLTSLDPRWRALHEDGSPYPGEEHPIMRALSDGIRVNTEILGVFNPADGKMHWTEVSAIPEFRPGEEKPYQAYAIFADIDERKQTQDALRESEQRYRLLFEKMNEGFALHEIVCDDVGEPTDYRFLELNPAFERLTGLKSEEIIGQLKNTVIPGDDPNWIKIYGRVALTGQPVEFENYSPALQRHYHVSAFSPIHGQFAVMFTDITERVNIEMELRSANERTKTVLSSITDAYMAFDSEWRFIEINPVAEQYLLRRPASELLGQVVMEVYPNLLVRDYYRQHLSNIEQGQPFHFEAFFGEPVGWYEVHAYTRSGRTEFYLRDISERKRAEEQAASLAKFPLENPNPVLRLNREGKLLFANKASQLILEQWGCQVGDPAPAFWREVVIEALDQQSIRQVELNCGQVDYLIKACSIPDDSYVNVYGLDITERNKVMKELETARDELEIRIMERTAELKRNETLLRTVLEILPVGVWVYDAAGTITFGNPAAQLIWGGARYVSINGYTEYKGWWLNSGKPIQPEEWGSARAVQKGETSIGDEVEIECFDGTHKIILNSGYPLWDDQGKISGAVVVNQDITERMRNQQRLIEDRQRLVELSQSEREQRLLAEALVHAAQVINSSLNLDQVLKNLLEQIQGILPFTAANIGLIEGNSIRISQQLGLDMVQAPGPAVKDVYALNDFPIWEKAIQTRQIVLVPDTHDDRDWVIVPETAWVRSMLLVPLLAGEQVVGTLNLMHYKAGFFTQMSVDSVAAFANQAALAIQNAHLYHQVEDALSKEQAMREQLIQAEKLAAMGRLLGSVAHELNNPLQTIQNCLYLTRLDSPKNSPVQEYLDMANSETNRIATLVAQLRELYRPRTIQSVIPASISTILEEVHGLLSGRLESSHIEWKSLPPKGEYIIDCIPDQIKQVFLNIGSNAIDAMQPNGGLLQISQVASSDGSNVGVVFCDQGHGIPAEALNNLFEPFYTTKPSGLGLGLSICRELVERHNGWIDVKSEIDQGSTFTIWLPLANDKI